MLEKFLKENTDYVPPEGYNALTSKKDTWKDYDPDIWIGAMRDSDGVTWRFDQYATSRNCK